VVQKVSSKTFCTWIWFSTKVGEEYPNMVSLNRDAWSTPCCESRSITSAFYLTNPKLLHIFLQCLPFRPIPMRFSHLRILASYDAVNRNKVPICQLSLFIFPLTTCFGPYGTYVYSEKFTGHTVVAITLCYSSRAARGSILIILRTDYPGPGSPQFFPVSRQTLTR
jgi:hypothetical protein